MGDGDDLGFEDEDFDLDGDFEFDEEDFDLDGDFDLEGDLDDLDLGFDLELSDEEIQMMIEFMPCVTDEDLEGFEMFMPEVAEAMEQALADGTLERC